MIQNVQAILLAADKSCSLSPEKSKFTEKICGQELIVYPAKLLASLHIPTTIIAGTLKETFQEILTHAHANEIHIASQDPNEGTGHAIMQACKNLMQEHVLIMHGDMPLVTSETIERLFSKHIESKAAVSFVVAHNQEPSGHFYGRVVKQEGNKIKIIPAKDFDGDVNDHCCVDAGIYIVTKQFLSSHIHEIEEQENHKKLYFTDIIKIASEKRESISTIQAPFEQIRGINNFQELWAAEHIKRSELIKNWMNKGVRFSVPQSVVIDIDVEIGAGSFIGCGVHLLKGTKIGTQCTIQEFCAITGSTIANNTTIYSHCIVKDSHIGTGSKIGPFAHITEHSTIEEHATIGNFVEVKRTTIGKKSKAKHLAYLGDASIGNNVNIGAGTITCNHDGTQKHPTTIKDGAYIGSNNTLVAPITIQENAFTAAGSTITMDVPQDALGIGRARQVNKEGYAQKLRTGKTEQAASFIGAVKTNNDNKLSEGQ